MLNRRLSKELLGHMGSFSDARGFHFRLMAAFSLLKLGQPLWPRQDSVYCTCESHRGHVFIVKQAHCFRKLVYCFQDFFCLFKGCGEWEAF